jgi:hypothetical protein
MNYLKINPVRSLLTACAAVVLLATQPVSAAVTQIILKADDMVAYGGDSSSSPAYMSSGWINFIQMLKDKNIVANVGIIGSSCDRVNDTKFWTDIKTLISSEYIELFNHGYTHQDGGYPAFHPGDSTWQKDDLTKNQALVKSKAGFTMIAVGLPANAYDSASTTAINAMTDPKYWIFGPSTGSNKKILYRDGNLESTAGNMMSYSTFVANYPTYVATAVAAGRTYLCFQVHPHLHSTSEQATLAQIVDFLKTKSIKFRRLSYLQ